VGIAEEILRSKQKNTRLHTKPHVTLQLWSVASTFYDVTRCYVLEVWQQMHHSSLYGSYSDIQYSIHTLHLTFTFSHTFNYHRISAHVVSKTENDSYILLNLFVLNRAVCGGFSTNFLYLASCNMTDVCNVLMHKIKSLQNPI